MTTARNLSFILAIAILLLVGCGDEDARQVSRPPSEVEQELRRGLSLVRMFRGRTKWKLNADEATFLESDRVRVKGVKLLIFGDKEGEILTIHGDEGEVDQRTDNIKITGNVEGSFSDGGHLATEEIYWRDRTGKIYTLPGAKVTITYEDSVIVGEELEADPKLETWEMKNVTGVTKEKQSEKSAEES